MLDQALRDRVEFVIDGNDQIADLHVDGIISQVRVSNGVVTVTVGIHNPLIFENNFNNNQIALIAARQLPTELTLIELEELFS